VANDLGHVELAIRPYRLRFKHPFGTAHGLRDGTDSVLIRVSDGRLCGHGEATTPPYVGENQQDIMVLYGTLDPHTIDASGLMALSTSLDHVFEGRSMPAARAGLHMAFADLILKRSGLHASTLCPVHGQALGKAVYTLGTGPVEELEARSRAATDVPVLKVKLDGTAQDIEVLRWFAHTTDRPILLDANEGLTTIGQAMARIEAAGGPARAIGLEQPFHRDDLETHAELCRRTSVPVIADESVQGPEDLEARAWAFTGVNVKLMKCGGLDRAVRMIAWARGQGKLVMLGSMSESSLGCAAMAALGGAASLCDLDGPWLIDNDPFTGFALVEGSYRSTGPIGFGVEPAGKLFDAPIDA
jgi:L-alanine-DL-glutamate epimerase-like enolase superfamily enzyme